MSQSPSQFDVSSLNGAQQCDWYLTIFFDLLGELYVRVLSVKVFVEIVDSLFVYGGECVVNVT